MPVEDTQLGYGGSGIEKWLLHKWIKDFSDSNFEIVKSCWCFDWMLLSSSGWWIHSVKMPATRGRRDSHIFTSL